MTHFKKTKIVSTVGPALTMKLFSYNDLKDPSKKEIVKQAFDNIEAAINTGVNTFRLNFSHGTTEEQMIRVNIIREVSKKMNRNISLMLDTKGPEIRVCAMEDSNGVQIVAGSTIVIESLKKVVGNAKTFSVTDYTETYNMAKDVKVGATVLVDDGKLCLQATNVDVQSGTITALVKNTHLLKTNKRINLPAAEYSMPFLSQKDIEDITLAAKENFDYIAASFVNTAKDVADIRAILKNAGNEKVKIISKVESTQAIANIDEIIAASDGIMVARGDLGLEIPYYEVPQWEKYMVKACRFANKPVIVATQMLDSLERNIYPTRAEVTDIFFAVDRGTDATMLSGETAQGLYPINSIEVMSNINRTSEELFDYDRALKVYYPKTLISKTKEGKIAAKIVKESQPVREMVVAQFQNDYLIAFTNNRKLLEALSACRTPETVIAVTSDLSLRTAFGIYYGIETFMVDNIEESAKNITDTVNNIFKVYPKGTYKVLINNKIIKL